MNRNQVIDILKMVVAADHRTADSTDVDVWEAVIGELDFDRARKAVIDHLREMPGTWLEPGHVRQRVKASINDEIQRTDPDVRPMRDVAEPEPIRALAASMGLPSFERPSRSGANALEVACDFCGARVGQHCSIQTPPGIRNKPRRTAHPSRIERAQAMAHGKGSDAPTG